MYKEPQGSFFIICIVTKILLVIFLFIIYNQSVINQPLGEIPCYILFVCINPCIVLTLLSNILFDIMMMSTHKTYTGDSK